MKFRSTLLFSLILLSVSVLVISDDDKKCRYIINVKTGNVDDAGTDSTISATLGTKFGETVFFSDLASWGGVPDVNYFERNSLDFLNGNGKCLISSICSLTLKSDGSGNNPSWFVDYVEVTYIGLDSRSQQQKFSFNRWLALDIEPFTLIAVENLCQSTTTPTMITTGTLARLVSQV